jgi:hypothetical protein
MPDEDRSQLNPQIASAKIGVRYLRNIPIYPLAVGDQLSLTNMISEAISSVAQSEDDIETAGIAIRIIEDNLPIVLEFITDTENETPIQLLKDITNTQAVEIAEIVYEQNYAALAKKVQGLFDKMGKMMDKLPSKGPSLPSANSMDIDSKTSTESTSEKVD